VREIAPEANRQKATIQVKVAIKDPDDYLRPETNAKVNFLEDRGGKPVDARARVFVPKAAILAGPSLFVVRAGKAEKTPIVLGPERNGKVEILSGLSGGEPVVVAGMEGLTDRANVAIKR
jgi:HlyD family secretion protein